MPIRDHWLFPFADIIETQTCPHARTLRTSFSQKLWDCYHVIAGSFSRFSFGPTRCEHIGVFDYLTLGIPFAFIFLTSSCVSEESKYKDSHLLHVSLAIILFIFCIIPRAAFSTAVTIFFSPLIALVHGFTRLISGEKTQANALSIQGTTCTDGRGEKRTTLTLKQYIYAERRNK